AASNPIARHMRMVEVPLANAGDATLGGLASPGVGRIRVRVSAAHPHTAGLPETVELVHYNGPLFAVAEHGGAAATPPHVSEEPTAFAWPVAATPSFTPAERFLVASDDLGERQEDRGDTTLQRCIV